MHLAHTNAANAHALCDLLLAIPGVKPLRSGVFFNEFSIELPLDASLFCARMREKNVFAGVPVDAAFAGHERGLLIAVTETKTLADLEAYAKHAALSLKKA